jgi:hypothetical protein
MKFERMKLPVLTGMAAIEKYAPKEAIYLSSVRIGLPCLIMNEKVCDITGKPFKNELFQEDFKEFSKRVNDCKTIVFGRVVDIRGSYKNQSIYDLGDVQRITYNSNVFARHKDSVRIEVEDLYSIAAPSLTFKDRQMFLKNMILSIFATTKKTNVELQDSIILETYNKASVNKFIFNAAERNETVLFRNEKFLYTQGDAQLNEARSFYLNPFEEFEGDIKSLSFNMKQVVEVETEQNHLNIVKVSSNGNLATIDFSKQKLAQRRLFYRLISEKAIKSIKFEAILFEGLLKYERPL